MCQYVQVSVSLSKIGSVGYNTGAASSKSYLWPITDTECQVWTQILRSTFLKLIPWRLQMSIEKTIPNTFLIMTVSTSIIIYLFSKNCWRSFIFNKNPYHFHNNTQFCIFEHITNSSFCHVFVIKMGFVTFQDIENNQEYKPKHNKS